MGDRAYYISFMKMKDVAERIAIAEEIHNSKKLNELIQRQLSDRAPEISHYLLNQPQRFFNAFVVGVYGGHPQWFELEVHDNPDIAADDEIPSNLEGSLGFLVLEGTEKLFAIDGQHRVAGIQEAYEKSSEVAEEEVAAIFVSHSNTEKGMTRTRRLFTTLNRYAKALNKREAIALDEDDIVAIITRRLVEEHPFFSNRVNTLRSKSLPKSDKENITSIIALYDALNEYLRDRSNRSWGIFKRNRPPEDALENWYLRTMQLWDQLSSNLGVLATYGASTDTAPAAPFRHENGGHLLFRPIGFTMIINTIKLLENEGLSVQESTERIVQVPMELQNAPWSGLLWDSQNKRMISSAENKKAAAKLMLFGAGGDLGKLNSTKEALKEELAGLMNMPIQKIKLNQFVI